MSQPVEVFENEEASKLLDYFVAYKKLLNKVEYIKCVSALNSEVRFNENPPQPENNSPNLISQTQQAMGVSTEFDR